MFTLEGHTRSVRAVEFCPDGRLVSGGEDRTLRIWDVSTGQPVVTIAARRIIYTIAVSRDGQWIAYSGRPLSSHRDGNSVSILNAVDVSKEPDLEWEMYQTPPTIWSLAISADGRYVVAACRKPGGGGIPNGASAHWWDRTSPDRQGELPQNQVYSLAFAPVGHALAIARRKTVDLLDSPDEAPRTSFELPSDWAEGIAYLPNSKTVVVGINSFLCFLDTDSKQIAKRVKTGIPRITCLCVSNDGSRLAIGGRAPEGVEIYSLPDRQLLRRYDFQLGGVNGISFSPDGLTLAIGGERGIIICDT